MVKQHYHPFPGCYTHYCWAMYFKCMRILKYYQPLSTTIRQISMYMYRLSTCPRLIVGRSRESGGFSSETGLISIWSLIKIEGVDNSGFGG